MRYLLVRRAHFPCTNPPLVLLALLAAGRAPAFPPAQRLTPPGNCTVELVAAPPLVEHPMMAGFDEDGRLYVADSAGMNRKADELQKDPPNRIVRLVDENGDGRFDRSDVFADRMTFPMGALWKNGSLYVASPPSIWKLGDSDGDGRADQREELVGRFGFIGNAADIHGCFWSPLGRVFWCDGRHGHDIAAGPGRARSKGKAARIFSVRPDGTDVEALAGGGMDNPVEVAFTAEGDVIGTVALFDAHPRREDALVHWVRGGVYPRAEQTEVLAEFRRTGDLLPPIRRFGQIAPAGILIYQSEAIPGLQSSLLFAQFNTHKVVRSVLERHGSTYRASAEDFLTCDDPDFHPTDVVEDADGSLLVIDTGGWFYNGCPHSKTAKPDIKGGIYRVRPARRSPPRDPRGAELAWRGFSPKDLVALLSDPRPAVRDRAVERLVERGSDAVPTAAAGLEDGPIALRRQCAWALARIGDEPARKKLREALLDEDSALLLPLIKGLGELRDEPAVELVRRLLERSTDPFVRREAASFLGRMRDKGSVPALLAAIPGAVDRFEEHAILYALLEIGDAASTRPGLSQEDPRVRRGALIVLDQLPGVTLREEEVLDLLASPDGALEAEALGVLARRPELAGGLEKALEKWLSETGIPAQRRAALLAAIPRLAQRPNVQRLLGNALAAADGSADSLEIALAAAAHLAPEVRPKEWSAGIARALGEPRPSTRDAAVRAAAGVDDPAIVAKLREIARSENVPTAIRLAAARSLAASKAPVEPALFTWLLRRLSDSESPADRLDAAEVLGASRLTGAEQWSLLERLGGAGTLEFAALLEAFATPSSPEVSEGLTRALDPIVQRRPELAAVVRSLGPRLLAACPAPQKERLQKVLDGLPAPAGAERIQRLDGVLAGGDARKGRDVFHSAKASCFACHRAGAAGGEIGPDLSKIGAIRSRRDLLESVVLPSASFVRGYESRVVATHGGEVLTGVVRSENSDEVVLVDSRRRERRLPRDQIVDVASGAVSIMPEGLDHALSEEELRDLMAFLESLK